ncbi:MAG TPA: type I restriction enzyme HsdR N-terminal domain-containing protein [Sandaracinaceae bacterium LLY-WYZ-13_1]|nr:type I restriction enzyme HsdR N-terminal domain-containing protein [Sandaracinaceae bacterium LLY-WYZ-13_1]
MRALAARAPDLRNHCATEEATKTALVLPFIAAMGYDVFDPTEVVPEFVADVGIKKGEKIDYAIRRDGEIVLLIECKACGDELSMKHASQLYRYFSVTKARIAVLTNGLVYHFFSDLEEPNKLDERPFLILDLLALRDDILAEASKMAKGAFDLDEMLSSANALKYQREIRYVLEEQLEEPEEEFVKFFHARVGAGRFVQSAKEEFTPLVRKAFWQLVSDRVSERLRNALATEGHGSEAPPPSVRAERGDDSAADEELPSDDGVVTTEEELEGFRVVRAIVCSTLPPERIVYRDAKTYFAVLCDDNNRKPLCRLWFNTSQKYLGLLDEEKNETRHPIEAISDIYRFADELRQAGARYLDG